LPCGSEAARSRVSAPMHQPLLGREQFNAPEMTGGKDRGGSHGSHVYDTRNFEGDEILAWLCFRPCARSSSPARRSFCISPRRLRLLRDAQIHSRLNFPTPHLTRYPTAKLARMADASAARLPHPAQRTSTTFPARPDTQPLTHIPKRMVSSRIALNTAKPFLILPRISS